MRNASPLTFIRLLGTHHPDRDTTVANSTAGWETSDFASDKTGGTYGLFVAEANSGSTAANAALAAIVYVQKAETAHNATGAIGLIGQNVANTSAVADGNSNTFATAQWVLSEGTNYTFNMRVGGTAKTFNLDSSSDKFIRNILNTNPTADQAYFLGETYETHVNELLDGAGKTTKNGAMAILLPLRTVATGDGDHVPGQFEKNLMALEAQEAVTPWIIGQHIGSKAGHKIVEATGEYASGVEKLFKLFALSTGAWASANLKVTIEDIKAPIDDQYGTFTVALRKVSDSDKSPVYVERFTGCDLNPNSTNYISRRIGDVYSEWRYDESRYVTSGDYPNISRFLRVYVNPDPKGDMKASVPFGFYGPAVPRPIKLGVSTADPDHAAGNSTNANNLAISTTGGVNVSNQITSTNKGPYLTGASQASITLFFPAMPTRSTSSDGILLSGSQASFGITTNISGSKLENPAYADLVKPYSQVFANAGVIEAGGNTDTYPALSATVFRGEVSSTSLTDIFATTLFNSTNNTQDADIADAAGDWEAAGVVSAFTLDDLVLKEIDKGASQYTVDTTNANWYPGSRYFGSAISVRGGEKSDYEGDPATAILAISGDLADAGKLTLTDYANSSVTFIIDNTSTLTSGEVNTSNEVIVGIKDNTGKGDQLQRLATVINNVTSHDQTKDDVSGATKQTLEITAVSKSETEILLIQNSAGTGGNKDITFTALTTLDVVDGNGDATATDTFADGSDISADENGSYKDVLDLGFDKFTVPLFGGFDGLDITEKEPFRNTFITDQTSASETTNYAYNSIKRAIDTLADPEVVEMNLATIPGTTVAALTSHLIDTCEARGDSLAIIDLENDYRPKAESSASEMSRIPDVANAVASLKARSINSSYGCAYFPWVQIRDSSSDTFLWAPPSIAALGTMASSERKSELWFAPAGFNRGGLTEGSAGIPVTQTRLKLTSKDRDKLYEANINPIASFPSEGIVIFGQKTLQVTPSALDRINVRRLLIYLKKEVSRIATGILFDNNVPATWQRFTSQVEPFLASVKSRFGLSDFRVILDESTTTPDLVDRNVLYAKVMLKPARAIEFIAIDFVITRSGASFDD